MLDTDPASPDDGGALSRTPQMEREFAAALRLRDWVRDLRRGPARTEWTMAPGSLNNLFVVTCGKGTKTFRAAVLLCDRGYGPQAGI